MNLLAGTKPISNGSSLQASQSHTEVIKKAKKAQLSGPIEGLSVYDGITVQVQYIGDSEQESSTSTGGIKEKSGGPSNGLISGSSKELLLSLEQRKKAAAEVTTVPLRQPLCANYKSLVTSSSQSANTRQNSFTGRWCLSK